MSFNRRAPDQPPPGRMMPIQTVGNLGESKMDLPSSLVEVAPFLWVAGEVETSNPRVAYLCRFYAFEVAHRLDPTGRGRGVRQFKTAFLQRLERDNEKTLARRTESDAREMQSFYQHYYKNYIQELENAADEADRSSYKNISTAAILFEVLKAVSQTKSVDVADEMLKAVSPTEPAAIAEEVKETTSSLVLEKKSVMDSELPVPPSLVEIAPILWVANEVEAGNPRVAYLCRFYAFEVAHRLDPRASGWGVRQFKTALIQRLDRENETTLRARTKNDAHEMQSFYQHYKQKYIPPLQNAGDEADRAPRSKECQIAAVLLEVLKAVNGTTGGGSVSNSDT